MSGQVCTHCCDSLSSTFQDKQRAERHLASWAASSHRHNHSQGIQDIILWVCGHVSKGNPSVSHLLGKLLLRYQKEWQ